LETRSVKYRLAVSWREKAMCILSQIRVISVWWRWRVLSDTPLACMPFCVDLAIAMSLVRLPASLTATEKSLGAYTDCASPTRLGSFTSPWSFANVRHSLTVSTILSPNTIPHPRQERWPSALCSTMSSDRHRGQHVSSISNCWYVASFLLSSSDIFQNNLS